MFLRIFADQDADSSGSTTTGQVSYNSMGSKSTQLPVTVHIPCCGIVQDGQAVFEKSFILQGRKDPAQCKQRLCVIQTHRAIVEIEVHRKVLARNSLQDLGEQRIHRDASFFRSAVQCD